MNLKSALAIAAFSLTISAVSTSAEVPPRYSVTDIGFLAGFANMTGLAIDDHGDVVGYAHEIPGPPHPPDQNSFLYSQGSLINLDRGYTYSFATGVNDNQAVIGMFDDVGDNHPFLYLNGESHQIDVLAGYTYVSAINNVGQIVGYTRGYPLNGPPDYEQFAFLMQPNFTIVQLPAFKNAMVYPVAINDIGQIVGNVQYTDSHGNSVAAAVKMGPGATTFYLLHGLNYVTGMSSSGHVVGYAVTAAGEYGVLRAEGKAINLGPVSPTGINNRREIVGTGVSTNGTPIGEVYIKGQWYDLNALVNSTVTGLTISAAKAINNLGQILATASDTAGNTHTVILTVKKKESGDNRPLP
jgi:uncharacterized membrane protein